MCILVFIKIDNDRNYFLRLELRNNHYYSISVLNELKMIDITINETELRNGIFHHLLLNKNSKLEGLNEMMDFAKKYELFNYNPNVENRKEEKVNNY